MSDINCQFNRMRSVARALKRSMQNPGVGVSDAISVAAEYDKLISEALGTSSTSQILLNKLKAGVKRLHQVYDITCWCSYYIR